MVEESDLYSLMSLGTSVVALALAVLVWRRHPGRRAGRTFASAMAFFLLAAVFAYFVREGYGSAWSLESLQWTLRGFYFVHMLAVGFTAAFVGAYFFGFAIFRRRSVATFLYFSLGAAAVLVASLVSTRSTPIGPMPDTTLSLRTLFGISATYGVMMIATIAKTLRSNPDRVVRRQATVMLAGILVHGGSAVTYGYLRLSREFPPPFLTITALGMAATFAVAVLRYRMFEVTPHAEDPAPVPRKFSVKAGHAYLVRERKPEVAFRALAEAARRGANGLVVSRTTPASVREDYDLQATPVLWLTTTAGQNHVPPTDPSLLERLVADFASRANEPVVAFEGIEYMETYADFDRVLRATHAMRDVVAAHGGTFLLSVNPGAFDERELALLDRDFEPLAAPSEPAVEDVFVIHRSGLLIAHEARRPKKESDRDIMASMLTAIMNFVRVSFAEGSDALKRLELGEKTVVIEQGDQIIAAVVYRGSGPADMDAEMRAFLWRAERRFGIQLERWSGDVAELSGLHAMTARLFI